MLEEIVEPLIQWYKNNCRTLPWREKKEAYHIWISEIMLQQTRVEAVRPYYERFIQALPDIQAVAECPQERLLKLWEGLGYYNRVRNIQKAALQTIEWYGGRLPNDYEKLKTLAGIGNYTAGAIASIAYDLPVPAVDGNVLRVYSRICEDYEDILKVSMKTRVEKEIERIIPEECPGIFNQALMELGAMICVPNGEPHCDICPIAEVCKARLHGTWKELPVKKKGKARKIEERTVIIIRDGERVAIRKRDSKGLLAGLYELPNLEGNLDEEEILEWVRSFGLTPLRILPLANAKHIFSHIEWHMKGYLVRVAQLDAEREKEMLFVETRDVEKHYPVPSAFQAYSSLMREESI